MKCPECGKETPSNKSHCQECGAKLKTEFRTCANGHQYSGDYCPYCPAEDRLSGIPTVVEERPAPLSEDRTVIEKSGPSVSAYQSPSSSPSLGDRTEIVTPSKQPLPGQPMLAPLGSEKVNPAGRKIVGFLVSYDIDPLGMVYNLYEGRNLIGRIHPASVLIPNSSVSDKHALILYRDEKFYLADELSTNGTFVNGEMIEEKVKLADRDEVKFGEIKTRFIII